MQRFSLPFDDVEMTLTTAQLASFLLAFPGALGYPKALLVVPDAVFRLSSRDRRDENPTTVPLDLPAHL